MTSSCKFPDENVIVWKMRMTWIRVFTPNILCSSSKDNLKVMKNSANFAIKCLLLYGYEQRYNSSLKHYI